MHSVHTIAVAPDSEESFRQLFSQSNRMELVGTESGFVQEGSDRTDVLLLTFKANAGLHIDQISRLESAGAEFVPDHV